MFCLSTRLHAETAGRWRELQISKIKYKHQMKKPLLLAIELELVAGRFVFLIGGGILTSTALTNSSI